MERISHSGHKLILFHKPKGVVVTRSDNLGRRTVYDCLPSWIKTNGWMPAGRLDSDIRRLLLFTMDGKILERLTRRTSPSMKKAP